MILRLKELEKAKRKTKLDIKQMLASEELQDKYKVEVTNRYNILMEETKPQYATANMNGQIDIQWNILRASISHGNTYIPKQEKPAKKGWMTCEILELMSKRKELKNKPEYGQIDKQIKIKCNKAKDDWYNHKCRMIEIAGLNNQYAHAEIKAISGKKRKMTTTNSFKK